VEERGGGGFVLRILIGGMVRRAREDGRIGHGSNVTQRNRGAEEQRDGGKLNEVGRLLVRILRLLQDRTAVRFWDLARAAKAEKAGFRADIGDYFFIFRIWGGARAGRFCLMIEPGRASIEGREAKKR
jgi:hypothetical protein